jgi:hypothetical protein
MLSASLYMLISQANTDNLAASTADLSLNASSDNPWPAAETPADVSATAGSFRRALTGPKGPAERVSKDPKFTPRAGGFWTHDQRHDDPNEPQGSQGAFHGNGRGRGGEPSRGVRGSVRGRGRGAFGPGGRGGYGNSNGGGWGQELTESADGQNEKNSKGEKRLEMDKLEAELEKKKEPKAEEESISGETVEVDVKPRDNKWGHEAFESMQAVQSNRNARGRGVGRGRGFPGESYWAAI